MRRGLYELLVTQSIAAVVRERGALRSNVHPLRAAEAADRISLHLARVIERAIDGIGDERKRVELGVRLARRLVGIVAEELDTDTAADSPTEPGSVLSAIMDLLPDGSAERIDGPLIPLLDTTLLTNSPGEPRVGHQIATEIQSAQRVDALIAFIRHSGIAPLVDNLRRHCEAGRELRVLTTTYTGSTEARALDTLRDFGADVRVSYDTTSTRLHAKAWLFDRPSGFSTAYIGSSNLTHSAQVSGIEWNVRLSAARNSAAVSKVQAVFESYWNGGEFTDYDPVEFRARVQGPEGRATLVSLSPLEVRLEPFQERLLEQIALARQQGHHHNLLVSATGTGKTVMAAVDYGRLRTSLPRARLLFVAHRQEILEQSLSTFRHVLREASFGELWVAGERPQRFEQVFASIQSLVATGFEQLSADHFDVVIVDEFHHAAASSYRALLDAVRPTELLGLTATPERSDGLPILDWFDGRIAAELRLWDAVDQHRLVPFLYYGIHDGLDLTRVPWQRGRGYDVEGLTNLFTADDAWVHRVIKQVQAHSDDIGRMRALGFCVSVDHARFMARKFQAAGISAAAIWADTPETERKAALTRLAAGELRIVFSVDLFNEGVDVPSVDTLLMLRPTDSPVLFLQQLGRGLRRHPGKTSCLILDFVGRHHSEFRFDRRLRAVFGGTRKELERHVEGGFPFLPAGCHMALDSVAREIVLENIRSALPARWDAQVRELRELGRLHESVHLNDYLEATGLQLEDIYTNNRGWSDLRAAAGLPSAASGPEEARLRRGCGRLLHVDDTPRIAAWKRLLGPVNPPVIEGLSTVEQRYLRMLVAQIMDQVLHDEDLGAACRSLWRHPQVRAELVELLDVLAGRIEHLPIALGSHPDVPLQVHARYTRIEILAAFGQGTKAATPQWREGVRWASEATADLLVFTLDKTEGEFSPTTRYRDYAISRQLIHWESQSRTGEDSPTGQRYRTHEARRSSIMLFARLNSGERSFYFLGPARYVKHEPGPPMAIQWQLLHPLTGDLYSDFAAAVA